MRMLAIALALVIGFPAGWIISMLLTPILWKLEPILHMELAGHSGPSDWVFAPQDREIQNEILAGWAAAAREIGDVPLPDVVGWLTRRRDIVAAGRSSIRVGHADFFARPTDTR